MLFKKTEYIAGPHGAGKMSEAMAFLRGLAERRINLDLEGFAGIFHRRRESSARRKIVIVLGLEKENWRSRITDRTSHQCLQFRRLHPTLRSAGCINCRAIGLSLRTQPCLNPAERIARDRNALRLNEALFSQPDKRRQLIIQVICFEQPYHGLRTCVKAFLFHGGSNLLADVGAPRATVPLSPPVLGEKHPATALKQRTD